MDVNGVKLLRPLCKGKGADIGCGPEKVTPGCIGIDIDPDSARDYFAEMDYLPFADNSLDFIVSAHCLEHAGNTRRVLFHWHDKLKPGAVCAVIVPHGEFVSAKTLGHCDMDHSQLFTPVTLRLFFEHVGFKHVESFLYERPNAYKEVPGIFCKGVK